MIRDSALTVKDVNTLTYQSWIKMPTEKTKYPPRYRSINNTEYCNGITEDSLREHMGTWEHLDDGDFDWVLQGMLGRVNRNGKLTLDDAKRLYDGPLCTVPLRWIID